MTHDASDPGFAALDATIAKAIEPWVYDNWGYAMKAARAVREALIADGHVPLGVGVAPDQHNTPHA